MSKFFPLFVFALIIVLSACQSEVQQPAATIQPTQSSYQEVVSTISSFEIVPINGSRLYRHPNAYYPVAYGYEFQFSIRATEGAVRFRAVNLRTQEEWIFGEFAGTKSNSMTAPLAIRLVVMGQKCG